MRWLRALWHAHNRDTDRRILWPVCKENAKTLDDAKIVFFFHATNDDAWTEHYTENEIVDLVDQLE